MNEITMDKGGIMKALTIHQPWASLMIGGHKTIENRSSPHLIILGRNKTLAFPKQHRILKLSASTG